MGVGRDGGDCKPRLYRGPPRGWAVLRRKSLTRLLLRKMPSRWKGLGAPLRLGGRRNQGRRWSARLGPLEIRFLEICAWGEMGPFPPPGFPSRYYPPGNM